MQFAFEHFLVATVIGLIGYLAKITSYGMQCRQTAGKSRVNLERTGLAIGFVLVGLLAGLMNVGRAERRFHLRRSHVPLPAEVEPFKQFWTFQRRSLL
jgi:hypothetical protein